MAKSKRDKRASPQPGDRVSRSLMEIQELFQTGRAQEGLAQCNELLASTPNHPIALYLKGSLLLQLNDPRSAAAVLQQVTLLQPDDEKAYTYLAIALQAMGDLEQAAKACGLAILANPDFAQAHTTLGDIHFHAERFELAAAAQATAVRLDDGLAIAHHRLGNALRQLARPQEAVGHFERARKLAPNYWGTGLNLGAVYRATGRREAAVEAYERAYEVEPRDAGVLHNMGDVLQELGRADEAARFYREELALEGRSARALFGLTETQAISADGPERATIEELLEKGEGTPRDTAMLHMALGYLLHSVGEYDAAFEQFSSGNQQSASTRRYDHDMRQQELERQKRTFTEIFLRDRKGWGAPSEVPVFIVGMPRSGKSMVERILMTDPHVHGAGERRQPVDLLRIIAQRIGAKQAFPECLLSATAADVVREGRSFLADLQLSAPEANAIVDTAYSNVSALGMIGLILPNARIIHCVRDPVETGLACFMKFFDRSNGFDLDLADVGKHIQYHSAFMTHWQAVLPNPWLEVRFENLISDRKGTVEQLNEFLGIKATAGDDGDFPIRGAIADVDRYDKFLGPLIDVLDTQKR